MYVASLFSPLSTWECLSLQSYGENVFMITGVDLPFTTFGALFYFVLCFSLSFF